jgi:hypothetical protein
VNLGISTFFIWAFVLILQNFAFTFVSRARNSGSIKRHMVAAVFSNGVWFLSQIIIFEQMYRVMKGTYGLGMAIFVGVYYTVFTMMGSLIAHYYALRNEKGKARIGAYKDVATFTKAEGDILRVVIAALKEDPDFEEEMVRLKANG